MKKRIASLLLALIMACSLVPAAVFAAEHPGQIHVTVENTTFAEGTWTGTLADEWVDITATSTAMTCIVDALGTHTQTGAAAGYITEIDGLKAGDGGAMSGWMITLNDWFTNEGLATYTVENGKLSAGDEIRVMYTCDFGPDIGSDWSNNDKTLQNIAFSIGTLDKVFASDTNAYVLTVPTGTNNLTVASTASNKNFQVRTCVGETEYKRTQSIPVADGTVITVKCGDPTWPSMNNAPSGTADSVAAKTYCFTVSYGQTARPTFTSLAFQSTQITSAITYNSETTAYSVTLKSATVGLMLTNKTAYDAARYTAAASYRSASGENKSVAVKNGASTTLGNAADFPFGTFDITLTITEKANAANKTDYVIHVTRPRDTTSTLKSITLVPTGRALMATLCHDQPEGTLFYADETGALTSGAKFKAAQMNYRVYAVNALQSFSLNYVASSTYAHLRYSTDNGSTWSDSVQSADTTAAVTFPASAGGNAVSKVMLQVIDDAAYTANTDGGKDAFIGAKTYTIWVEQDRNALSDAQIMTATVTDGDWYPAFSPETLSYAIVVPNGTKKADMAFTVSAGASVMLGKNVLATETDGSYKIELTTSAQTVKVTSANGSLTNSYSFKLQPRSQYGYADRVVDYLPINSQYTNRPYGINPEATLAGNMVSLGNWGGYITYYFDTPLTDDPNNKYGMDFYAYGNSFSEGGSAAENGQIWVSEDGVIWYALAGSEHYEDDVLWDYQVTYTATAAGKTAWTDNRGNSNDGSSQSGAWVDPTVYYLNGLAKSDTITLSGIVMYSQGGTIRGDSSTGSGSFTHAVRFGYVDYFGNGTVGADVNPYVETPAKANGFDLAWAVDAQGDPVDVSDMAFHYVKVVTANNIWAGAFNEKSTESAGVVRTVPQAAAVGKTATPTVLVNGQVVDPANPVVVGDAFTVSVATNTDANVYINNQYTHSAEFDRLPSHQRIRVIVQEGDKEASIVTLTLRRDTAGARATATDIYEAVGSDLLSKAQAATPAIGSIGGDWMILGLARSGKITAAVANRYYTDSVLGTVRKNQLSGSKATENARVILAVTACDHDATAIGVYDLVAGFTSMEYVNGQGTNGPIWTLLALDSHDYAPPAGTDITRDKLIAAILAAQLADGGFYLSSVKETSDVDVTAMALQALAPYVNRSDVKSAVDRALSFLSAKQGADGDYGTSEACAQVIVALSALNIDAAADMRFVKNGTSVVEAMCRYYVATGRGFAHVKESTDGYEGMACHQMSTEQCYYALCAYFRMAAGKTALYDMSDLCLGLHDFTPWQTVVTPTDLSDGSRMRRCNHCGYEETEVLRASHGHDPIRPGTKPTADGGQTAGEQYTAAPAKTVKSSYTGDGGIVGSCILSIMSAAGAAAMTRIRRRKDEA